MAQFTKTHGDFQPVLHIDSPAYTTGALNAVTSGVAVQPQGPKLDYFTTTGTGHFTGAQVATIVQTLEQLATVHIYQFNTGGSNDTFAVALYPAGAWTTTNIDAQLLLAGLSGTTTATGATFVAGSDL
jgi:hypothetical protein